MMEWHRIDAPDSTPEEPGDSTFHPDDKTMIAEETHALSSLSRHRDACRSYLHKRQQNGEHIRKCVLTYHQAQQLKLSVPVMEEQ